MRNYTIMEVWGIPIRINVSLIVFLPILAYLIGSGQQIELYADTIGELTGTPLDLATLQAGVTPWLIGIVAAVGLFVAVTLHELGHSWVALRYGVEIESITLWILGGMAALSEIPREWNREFWIAIAGPFTSIVLAGAFWGGLLVIPESLPVVRFILGWLAIINLVLAAFNLLPAFPMDGGRILRALLARTRPYASATRIAARVGVIFAILFAIVGVFGQFNPILILLALFIYAAATTESRTVLLDELLNEFTVGDIMTRDPETVSVETSIEALIDRMIRDRTTIYPVTEGESVVGVVTLNDLREVTDADKSTTTVRTVMQDVPSIEAGADAFDTLAANRGRDGLLMLVNEGGALAGVISESDYTDAISMQKGFQSGLPR